MSEQDGTAGRQDERPMSGEVARVLVGDEAGAHLADMLERVCENHPGGMIPVEKLLEIAANVRLECGGWTGKDWREARAEGAGGSIDALADEVGRWHRSIFGVYDPVHHIRAIGQKAVEEAGELENAETRIQMRLEIADLLICGLAAADRLGVAPSEVVAEKLAILKRRGMEQLDRDKKRGIIQASEWQAATAPPARPASPPTREEE